MSFYELINLSAPRKNLLDFYRPFRKTRCTLFRCSKGA